ncbi:MAG: response regulator, partial [Deltaproteobacteria bacterium]|nr:response regulator [Deltaproteobacteria bacterium]
MGSPVHLSKTIMNLLSNAAEATAGKGAIHIATNNCYVDKPISGFDTVKEGEYATLMVQDEGIGISQDSVERIFEPFYSKKVLGRSGTGIGMAVVWGTIKDHKGYIDVRSVEEKGTTFTLYFPVTREEIIKKQPITAIDDYKGMGENILVVDDVAEQREIASMILTRLDYKVMTVSSGEEAVDYVMNQPVDLVVLDMIMDPGIDGLETYRRILALRPGQKAIITSGFSETDRVKEAQRLGARTYIKKPYLMEEIAAAVRNALDGKTS